jgi:hypothetical protein
MLSTQIGWQATRKLVHRKKKEKEKEAEAKDPDATPGEADLAPTDP